VTAANGCSAPASSASDRRFAAARARSGWRQRRPLRIALRRGKRKRDFGRRPRRIAAQVVHGAEHEFGDARVAPAQESFERGQQPLCGIHQLRGFGQVGRQLDARREARGWLVEALRIGRRPSARSRSSMQAAPKRRERGARAEQVADRRQPERAAWTSLHPIAAA
jgi:hypothetical protein